MKIGFCSIFINFRVGGEVEAAANAGGGGAAVYDNPADPLGHLNPHGQVWVPETCPIDPNIQTAYNLPCRLNWTILGEAHDLDRAYIHYFSLFFPLGYLISTIIPATNAVLVHKHAKPTSRGEMLKWFGLRCAMTLESTRGPVGDYWASPPASEESIYLSHDYSARFGMSRDRFKLLSQSLRLTGANAPPPQAAAAAAGGGARGGDGVGGAADMVEDADSWWPIRGMVDAVNDSIRRAVTPGPYLTVDEMMSFWYGLEGEYLIGGIPHATKIPRKPRSVGCELKCVADGLTHIMLRVEIQEGKEAMKEKEWNTAYGAGTSVTLRLTRPWAGTGRTVVGDSAFGSVKTLIALHKINGLFGLLMVKTAHTKYPMKYMGEWSKQQEANPDARRGAHVSVTSTYTIDDSGTNHKMFAVGWKDLTNKTIVSNRGTTNEGNPTKKTRHKVISVEGRAVQRIREFLVPRPVAIEMLFDSFGAVDFNDGIRQGIFNMEQYWKTRLYWHRILASLLGVIFTNCFLAYRMEQQAAHSEDIDDFNTFMGKLAYQLIFNPHIEGPRHQRKRAAFAAAGGAEVDPWVRFLLTCHFCSFTAIPSQVDDREDHDAVPLVQHAHYAELLPQQRARRACSICKKDCSYYCTQCSDAEVGGAIIALCNPTKSSQIGNSCLKAHSEKR